MTDILIRKTGNVGCITLTRPKSLNALTHRMALEIERSLNEWRSDDAVKCIYLDAEGDIAFCAGGDIVELYDQGMAMDYHSGQKFWRDEYRLNALMASYPKPIVAIMKGIVMGGGVGISAHCSHRIVTETTKLALPECSIGLVPDVGSTNLLANAPGHLGEYLGLTGYRMNGEDTIYCGFADHFMPIDGLSTLKEKLLERGNVADMLPLLMEPEKSSLASDQSGISAAFSGATLEDVVNTLRSSDEAWAADSLKKIERSSPLSCHIAFELIRSAREVPGVESALHREYCFVSRAMEFGDFLEGVRATVIDKDRNPRWRHTSIGEVTTDQIQMMLAPPEGEALKL